MCKKFGSDISNNQPINCIIELDPQSSLGNTPESLEILSQIESTVHAEHITIISRDGVEQKCNPNILGNITLDTSSFLTHFSLPLIGMLLY